jgi:hypothetical protein
MNVTRLRPDGDPDGLMQFMAAAGQVQQPQATPLSMAELARRLEDLEQRHASLREYVRGLHDLIESLAQRVSP